MKSMKIWSTRKLTIIQYGVGVAIGDWTSLEVGAKPSTFYKAAMCVEV